MIGDRPVPVKVIQARKRDRLEWAGPPSSRLPFISPFITGKAPLHPWPFPFAALRPRRVALAQPQRGRNGPTALPNPGPGPG